MLKNNAIVQKNSEPKNILASKDYPFIGEWEGSATLQKPTHQENTPVLQR